MPWPIWWTSFKPLRLATLKLLWCWSLNRRQVWKSESTSSNWHCSWISYLLIVCLHCEGLRQYFVRYQLFGKCTQVWISLGEIQRCVASGHNQFQKRWSPLGFCKISALTACLRLSSIVFDVLMRKKNVFLVAAWHPHWKVSNMPAVRHAWSFAPASRSWSVPRSPKWFVPKKIEDLRAHSWRYTITTTATDEIVFQLDGCLQSWGEWAECNLSISRAGDDGWYHAGRTFHFAFQLPKLMSEFVYQKEIEMHMPYANIVVFSKAPRLQRSTTSTALQGRDVLRGTVGSALLTGGLGGAHCLNCKVSWKIWIIMGGCITISRPRCAHLERPWPRCSSAAGWSWGFQATNSAGRHELTSGNDVTGDIE